MSAAVAAGCALSSDQSVSVVPTIQWLPHGMTNSTDFSVRRISPVSPLIRSRGTTMCTPLLARTGKRPRPPTGGWMSSVQTPVARRAGDEEVPALAGPCVEAAAPSDESLDVVGPHPGGIDDDLGLDVDLSA